MPLPCTAPRCSVLGYHPGAVLRAVMSHVSCQGTESQPRGLEEEGRDALQTQTCGLPGKAAGRGELAVRVLFGAQ